MNPCAWRWVVMGAVLFAGACAGVCQAHDVSAYDLAPWSANRHPTDARRRHVEQVALLTVPTGHAYTVRQGGTMDGRSCRSPVGAYGAFKQTWESNRLVRLENVGEREVVNPWLSNGHNDFRNIQELVSAAIEPGMSDKEKAVALYYQEIAHRYHFSSGDNDEYTDPVKVYNVYGFNTCGHDSICMVGLWKAAGLGRVTPAHVLGHCVSQVFFDNRWNLMDGDMQGIYLLRDNETVASEQDVAGDHDLIKRSHTQGILTPDSRKGDEWEASLYVYDGEATGSRNCDPRHRMDMVLRPNEALVWRWGHVDPIKCHGTARPQYPDTICNGLWEYRPDFGTDTWRRGAERAEGVERTREGLRAEAGRTGTIVWRMRSPYVIVGGRLETEGAGARFAVSFGGESWQRVDQNLDRVFSSGGKARYEYRLRCELAGDARLGRLAVVNDLQMAPLVLPEMVVGENRFVYTDQTQGRRKVRITHEWVERSATRPPEAPARAVYPKDRGASDGTDIVFKWTQPSDPDGDRILDYHFELSDRADMRWPLSTNFAKLISLTADKGKAQYSLPYPGLLTPERTYYWRVRAKDARGMWGPWGKAWRFTARGPARPLELRLDYDPRRRTGILRWNADAAGSRPAKYRVYGSNEKGFSVSDTPHEVSVGGQSKMRNPFPANFVAETGKTELRVVGVGLDLPSANKAFYRVVSVNGQGRRSGPSDYAEATRPVIYSGPVTAARLGQPYRCQAATIRSWGGVKARTGRNILDFWDVEEARFSLVQGPGWLKIDGGTGLLSGTPDAAGRFKVVVAVTLEKTVRKLDLRALSWGGEKVLGTSVVTVGNDTQEFAIDIRR